MSAIRPYDALHQHFARIGHVEEAIEYLYWDMATQMPSGGADARGEQLATLKVIEHQLTTDPRVGDWLAGAEAGALDDWQRANVRECRRLWTQATAVPEALVEALSKAGSTCGQVWRGARAQDDFAAVAPHLSEVFARTREVAQIKGEVLGLDPYDALLDGYEPGARRAQIDDLFGDLAEFLPGFTADVIEAQASRGLGTAPAGPFPIAAQREVGLHFMKVLGFDFDHGRLDVSAHPFCGGGGADVRITTRYREDDFVQSLMGVLHETGHALYEQGRPMAWRAQPVGRARSMGVHESQSLLMEMQACRSQEFLALAAPVLARHFGGGAGDPVWGADNLYKIYTQVDRGLIRVDADEVTYPAHVILRYRLETALVDGTLAIADLPDAWRAQMVELVGVANPDHKDGCLQDVHWMEGLVGYFPTYTLGAMMAAQLFDAACTQVPGVRAGIAGGDFSPLLGWLRANVHGHGSFLSTDELLTRATGRPLDASVFKAHLTRRYLQG